MRARHALQHALLQCTEDSRCGCSLRITVQCAPQGEMGRTRGVSMTKFKMSKADLHNEVHLCYLHQVPAAAMPPPPPVSPTGPCFCRVLICALQSMAPCDVQVY